MKDKSRGFSSQDTTDLKAVVAQVMGWGEESEATEIESKRIIHKIETSKRMINRPIAYAIGMAKKLSDHQT
jgi:predicted transcriptional regulator